MCVTYYDYYTRELECLMWSGARKSPDTGSVATHRTVGVVCVIIIIIAMGTGVVLNGGLPAGTIKRQDNLVLHTSSSPSNTPLCTYTGTFSHAHSSPSRYNFIHLVYSLFMLRSPQEVWVGLKCAIITCLWVGGQSAITQMDSRLYTANLHLKFFAVGGMP